MKKAAIVMDNYKIKIFRKNLKNAGFEWTEMKFDKNSTMMKVHFKDEDINSLEKIIRESNEQGRRG